jgi:hypothetical protein
LISLYKNAMLPARSCIPHLIISIDVPGCIRFLRPSAIR